MMVMRPGPACNDMGTGYGPGVDITVVHTVLFGNSRVILYEACATVCRTVSSSAGVQGVHDQPLSIDDVGRT